MLGKRIERVRETTTEKLHVVRTKSPIKTVVRGDTDSGDARNSAPSRQESRILTGPHRVQSPKKSQCGSYWSFEVGCIH